MDNSGYLIRIGLCILEREKNEKYVSFCSDGFDFDYRLFRG